MNERWLQVRDRLLAFWNQYNRKQKTVLAVTAVLLLVVIIVLIYLLTRTEYEVAFQNLDSNDAAAIMEHLEGAGVSYRLLNGGTAIAVPSSVADRVRVDVGAQGLIQSGSIGFAELSRSASALGMTDQEFRVRYRNMLNGEIQQLLEGMTGVQRAKVLVTLPEESVFLNQEERERALASVRLTLKPGFRPTQEQIDSYFNLVKTSVPNLHIEDITITSQYEELQPSSRLLGASGSSGVADTQMEIRRQFENDMKRNIQTFLGRIVGIENMVVSVAAALNFDRKVTQEQLVQPLANNDNRGIVVSEQNTSSTFQGTDGQPGGVVGTGQTDIPNYPAAGASGTTVSEETSSTINYDYNRIINNIEYGPYRVMDLAVSVAIDSGAVTPESLANIEQMLIQYVRTQLADSGLDLSNQALAERVSVFSQEFTRPSPEPVNFFAAWWPALLAGLAAVGAVAAALAYRRRRQRKLTEEEQPLAAAQETNALELELIRNESMVRRQLEHLAKTKPEDFVSLLRTWLVDE